jgi:hypothetical protein
MPSWCAMLSRITSFDEDRRKLGAECVTTYPAPARSWARFYRNSQDLANMRGEKILRLCLNASRP